MALHLLRWALYFQGIVDLRSKYFYYIAIILFVIAGIFTFKNLGNIYLNADEAETALLSKSILKEGVPVGKDGEFEIRQNKASPFKSEESKVWIFHPWLQFYVTAGTYALLTQVNTFTSRFGFALSGFLLIVIFFGFLSRQKEEFGDFFVLAAFALLVFSTPIYLYIRQCRYYALNLLFSFALFTAYLAMLKACDEPLAKKENWKFYWVFFSFLLFYSNYAVFFAMYSSFLLHLLVFHRRKLSNIIIPSLITAAITLPGAVYCEIWKRKEGIYQKEIFSISKLTERVFRYCLYINNYHIPILFVLFFALLFLLRGKWKVIVTYFRRDVFTSASFVIIVNIVFFSSVILHDYRLFVHLVPFLVLFLAGMLDLLRREILPTWGVILLLLIFMSGNYINFLPLDVYFRVIPYKATEEDLEGASKLRKCNLPPFLIKPEVKKQPLIRLATALLPDFSWRWYLVAKNHLEERFWIGDYIYEITHDYCGPIKGAVTLLRKYARKGDYVKTVYGDLSLQFYLGDFMNVVPKLKFNDSDYPRWWIYRRQKRKYIETADPSLYDEDKILEKHYARYYAEGYPDIAYNNLPSPEYHYFRTAVQPEIVVSGDTLFNIAVFCRKDMLPYGE